MMFKLNRSLMTLALGAGLLALAPAASAATESPEACGGTRTADTAGDIVEVASHAGEFKTLLAAATAAGLVDVLRGEGPFTVFAPSDAAFAKLPAGTVEALLADKAKLRAILTYHIVPGKVMSHQAAKLDRAKTVNGEHLALSMRGGALMVDAARVTVADIRASNGVIHVIDSVVIPGGDKAASR